MQHFVFFISLLLVLVLTTILGIEQLSRSRRHTGTFHKQKLRGVLLIVGCLGLAGIGWFAVTAFRNLVMLGYVDSAIGSIRAVVAGETKFAEAHPELGYTCKLSALPADELIAELVENQRKNGYKLEITGCQATAGKGPNVTYQVTLRPLRAGMPAFCSNESGILKLDSDGSVQKCLEGGLPL